MSLLSMFRNRTTAGESSVRNLSPEAFLEHREPNGIILDVRTPIEYVDRHVRGSRNIDLYDPEFRETVDTLDRNRTYYLYCRSGNRSAQAASIMQGLGFKRVYNIGGLAALARAGVEVEV